MTLKELDSTQKIRERKTSKWRFQAFFFFNDLRQAQKELACRRSKRGEGIRSNAQRLPLP